MRLRFSLAAVPAIALVAFPLAAQGVSGSVGSQTQAEVQARTPKARIDAAMSAAAEARIPASLLESKVAEGEAKRVPPERIAAAVETRLKTLVRASDALKAARIESSTAAELSVAADALEAGVSQGALIRVYRNAPPERRVVAVACLADLVRLGNDSEASFVRVNAAVGSSAALANLQADVAAQLRLGGLGSTLDASGVAGIGGTVRIP